MRRALSLLIVILPAALAAGPAAADWLKTRDGALIETRGPWRVQGPMVVFTAPNGTLSSLRVSEVDLDASAVATMEAHDPPDAPEPVQERPEATFEITMKDVPRAAPPAAADTADEETVAPGTAAASTPAASALVQVIAWRPVEGPDGGFEIQGTLQNQGREIVTDLGVTVRWVDETGAEIGTANAFVGAASLAPNATTNLRALFPDVGPAAGEPSFEVRANGIRIEGLAAPRENASAGDADAES